MDTTTPAEAGYLIDGPIRTTWLMTHCRPPRISHPIQWLVTEPDGYQRFFDTRTQACTWVAMAAAEAERAASAALARA